MKRTFIIILIFAIGGIAFADSITPSQFIANNGLIVMDSDRLKGTNLNDLENSIDIDMAAFFYDDPDVGNAILWYKDGEPYLALDMISFLGSNTDYTRNKVGGIFKDFCEKFEFDLILFSKPYYTHYYATSLKAYGVAGNLQGALVPCITKSIFYEELDKIIS